MSFVREQKRLSRKSMAELLALQRQIETNPANRNPDSESIYLYSKNARRRLEALAWAITHKLAERRAERRESA